MTPLRLEEVKRRPPGQKTKGPATDEPLRAKVITSGNLEGGRSPGDVKIIRGLAAASSGDFASLPCEITEEGAGLSLAVIGLTARGFRPVSGK